MKLFQFGLACAAVAFLGFGGSANAAAVLCQDASKNHMLVDSAYVSTCIDAGVGNIGQGNQANDDWLNTLPAGHGYTTIGDQAWTQTGSSGTFTIDASQWNVFDNLFIGFKFGTGNKPDEWFVYQLQEDVSAGLWSFVNVGRTGGGLSHVSLYGNGTPTVEVPEPGTLTLLALALLGAGLMRRRQQ